MAMGPAVSPFSAVLPLKFLLLDISSNDQLSNRPGPKIHSQELLQLTNIFCHLISHSLQRSLNAAEEELPVCGVLSAELLNPSGRMGQYRSDFAAGASPSVLLLVYIHSL